MLLEVLHSLLISASWNKQLKDSAVELAQLSRQKRLLDKLHKFHSIVLLEAVSYAQSQAIALS